MLLAEICTIGWLDDPKPVLDKETRIESYILTLWHNVRIRATAADLDFAFHNESVFSKYVAFKSDEPADLYMEPWPNKKRCRPRSMLLDSLTCGTVSQSDLESMSSDELQRTMEGMWSMWRDALNDMRAFHGGSPYKYKLSRKASGRACDKWIRHLASASGVKVKFDAIRRGVSIEDVLA